MNRRRIERLMGGDPRFPRLVIPKHLRVRRNLPPGPAETSYRGLLHFGLDPRNRISAEALLPTPREPRPRVEPQPPVGDRLAARPSLPGARHAPQQASYAHLGEAAMSDERYATCQFVMNAWACANGSAKIVKQCGEPTVDGMACEKHKGHHVSPSEYKFASVKVR